MSHRPLPPSRLRPELLNVPILIGAYLGTALIAIGAERASGVIPQIVAICLIAVIQNYLQILQHEAAHGHLARSKKWNEWLGEISCAWPFFTSLTTYRHFHFEHHRHLLDPARDPEIEFYREQGYEFQPLSRWQWMRIALLDLTGVNAVRFFWSFGRYAARERKKFRSLRRSFRTNAAIAFALVIAMAGVLAPEFARLVFVYWIIPQSTMLFFLLKIQGYGEHSARTDRIETCTQDHASKGWTRWVVYPLNSHLHRTHHLHPERPWFHLIGKNGGSPQKKAILTL